MSVARPKLQAAKMAFKEVYEDVEKTVSGVGTKIGGKVDYNINVVPEGKGRFENACAIRLSYVLNKTGNKIPYIAGQTVSGQDGDWYIYKVKTMIDYLKKIFGDPDHKFDKPTAFALAKHKGILVFEVEAWSDATGHATIWNGINCSDTCYFDLSKKAYLWTLKD
jgi:hypothetical protein